MKPPEHKHATTQKSPASTESTKNDANASETPSKPVVREFLYLDYPKLTSYYAQLFKGMRTSFTHTQSEGKDETAVPPSTAQGFEATTRVAAGERASVAKLLGLVADLNLKVTRLVESAGTTVGRTEAETTAETTELHHDTFRRVEASLAAADLIETNTEKQASTRPFVRVTGRAAILVLDDFIQYVKENDTLNAALKGMGHQPAGAIEHGTNLQYVLERFYNGELGVMVSTKGGVVSASLDPQYLQAPIRQIINAFGRETQVPITILGLRARRAEVAKQKPIALGNFVSDLPRALLKVNSSLHDMDDVYQLRADLHLYPIAIYVDPASWQK